MKKIILSILMVLGLIALAGCDLTTGTTPNLKTLAGEIEIGFAPNSGDALLSVTKNVTLPSTLVSNANVTITWVSSDEQVIKIESLRGVVTRPQDEDKFVLLTATLSLNGNTEPIDFLLKVLKTEAEIIDPVIPDEPVDFEAIFDQIILDAQVTTNIILPEVIDGAILSWASNNEDVISSKGNVVRTSSDVIVTLTVTATKNDEMDSKSFQITVLKKDELPISNYEPIADVRLKAQGSTLKIEGVVTSLMSNGNYTIQDQSGAIPVYFGSGKNSELVIGTLYVIEGKLGIFNGLIQVSEPKIVSTGIQTNLPSVPNITGYSLDFDDVISYEAYVITYYNLEVTEIKTPSNAHEIYFKNEAGEASFVRLDTRVNSTNALANVQVGEIIDLNNVTVGQYEGKAQFLYTSRSSFVVKPKDANKPFISGTKNFTFVIGVDESIDFTFGVTAANANGVNYTSKLQINSSQVNYTVPGTYEVTYTLSGIAGYDTLVETIIVIVRDQSQVGVYTGYYKGLDGLTGSSLNSALASLIRNTGSSTGSTNQVKTVDSYNGTYYLIYTGNGSYGNREHVWPDSKLGSVKDDLHNLRASNVSVNSSRSNHPFIEKPSGNTGAYQKVGSGWYPGDEHVGDVARIVLYMHIRQSIPLNRVGNLQMFLRWHELDPVNAFEESRNDKIFSIQKNRNPFIDHPELVELYFGVATPRSKNNVDMILIDVLIANQVSVLFDQNNKFLFA